MKIIEFGDYYLNYFHVYFQVDLWKYNNFLRKKIIIDYHLNFKIMK